MVERSFIKRLGCRAQLIGVLHLPALPGAPRAALSLDALLTRVVADARAFSAGGADALLVENFGDAPFHRQRVEPQVLALMTRAALAVGEVCDLPLGINVLRNDARGALAVAMGAGAEFVRTNVLAGVVATDQGLIEGDAAEVLRYRQRLESKEWNAALIADVDVKHGRPLWGTSLESRVFDLGSRAGADALIVTGTATGEEAVREDVERVLAAASVPVLLGSGLTADNAARLLPGTRGAIVGTWVKEDGRIDRPVDAERVRALAGVARQSWGE